VIAIDTSVLVRFLVDDDKPQADLAEALIEANQIFLSRTVILETEWVLRSVYRMTATVLANLFDQLLGTENLVIEGAEDVIRANEWYKMGADFADALHLAACGEVRMHTFDQGFCKAAQTAGLAPGVTILSADGRS